ncbi:hypothetical protein ACFL6C_14330 [Myxococcota bacterium]
MSRLALALVAIAIGGCDTCPEPLKTWMTMAYGSRIQTTRQSCTSTDNKECCIYSEDYCGPDGDDFAQCCSVEVEICRTDCGEWRQTTTEPQCSGNPDPSRGMPCPLPDELTGSEDFALLDCTDTCCAVHKEGGRCDPYCQPVCGNWVLSDDYSLCCMPVEKDPDVIQTGEIEEVYDCNGPPAAEGTCCTVRFGADNCLRYCQEKCGSWWLALTQWGC